MDARTLLARCPLFHGLDPDRLAALAARSRIEELRSGQALFREGEPAEALYLVVAGRLRAVTADGRTLGEIGLMEPLGEIGLLAGDIHSATVHAVRDSLVLRIQREALFEVFHAYPDALLAVTRTIIERLRRNLRQAVRAEAASARAFAVIPASPHIEVRPLAQALHRALGESATRLIDAAAVDAELGPGTAATAFGDTEANRRLIAWLNELEPGQHRLLYMCNGDAGPWARRCMRQADRIVLVTDAAAPPAATEMIAQLKESQVCAQIELALLCDARGPAGDPLGWREITGARAHHFLRDGTPADIARLARVIEGRAVGLVLGGGGARAFAHIGVLRALEELGIPVDLAGGTSMGAFLSALTACGMDSGAIAQIARDTFVRHNYLNDYMIPGPSLIRGRRFLRRLREVFGPRTIEHLARTFFCVSTDLTRGAPVVHDRGELALWVATSMCVPGIAPPVAYKGDLLADGAVINSLPTDVMQTFGRGPIVASDIGTEGPVRADGVEGPDPEALLRRNRPPNSPSLMDILFRTTMLTSESGVKARAERADVYVRVPVRNVGLFEWHRLDEVAESGYRLALKILEPARAALLA